MSNAFDYRLDSAIRADNKLGPKGQRLGRMKSGYYDQIIEELFLNPTSSLSAIAKKLGKTSAWLSLILHSDSFKEIYAERRAARLALSNERIVDALHGVALRSLDIAQTRLDTNPEAVSTRLAMEIAEKSLDALGYTSKNSGAALAIANSQTNVTNVFGVDAEAFARAQGFIRDREQGRLADSSGAAKSFAVESGRGRDDGNPSSFGASPAPASLNPGPSQTVNSPAQPKSVEDLFQELFPNAELSVPKDLEGFFEPPIPPADSEE